MVFCFAFANDHRIIVTSHGSLLVSLLGEECGLLMGDPVIIHGTAKSHHIACTCHPLAESLDTANGKKKDLVG